MGVHTDNCRYSWREKKDPIGSGLNFASSALAEKAFERCQRG